MERPDARVTVVGCSHGPGGVGITARTARTGMTGMTGIAGVGRKKLAMARSLARPRFLRGWPISIALPRCRACLSQPSVQSGRLPSASFPTLSLHPSHAARAQEVQHPRSSPRLPTAPSPLTPCLAAAIPYRQGGFGRLCHPPSPRHSMPRNSSASVHSQTRAPRACSGSCIPHGGAGRRGHISIAASWMPPLVGDEDWGARACVYVYARQLSCKDDVPRDRVLGAPSATGQWPEISSRSLRAASHSMRMNAG